MNFTVVGLFNSIAKAKDVAKSLIDKGFITENIDVSPYTGNDTEFDVNYQEDEETGGFWNWLFGDDEDVRTRYSSVGSRNTVVTLRTHTRDEAERAVALLDEMGAIDVNEEFDRMKTVPGQSITDTHISKGAIEGEKVIPVVKEEIAVGKREVETGGVKVKSTIIEKPVEENIRLRHERVYVSRKAVDKIVDGTAAFQDKTVELTERNEEAVVEKTARVVEEITVGKEVEQVKETISDTVRETEIAVDDTNLASTTEGFKVSNFNDNKNTKITGDKNARFSDSRIDRAFADVAEANAYYDFLIEHGYSTDDITVLMSKDTKERFYAMNDHVEDTGDAALKGAGTGSAIGGTVGAIAGALATVGGAILVPGLGLAVAGPIAAALAGAGVGGATGALVGALTNAGLSDSLATEYNDALNRGEVIISVDPKDNDHIQPIGTYQYGRSIYNTHVTV